MSQKLRSKLIDDLKNAQRVASVAVQGLPDGGSCNVDRVFISVGKGSLITRKSEAWDQTFEEAGISAYRSESSWWKGYLLNPGVGGQAAVRLKACEVFAEYLTSQGWSASVFYQMD